MKAVTSKQAVIAAGVLNAVLTVGYKQRTVASMAEAIKATEADVIQTARELGLYETRDARGNSLFGLYCRVHGGDIPFCAVQPQARVATSGGSGCCSDGVPRTRDEQKCAVLDALKDRRWTQRSFTQLARIANTDEYNVKCLARELGARTSRDGRFASLRR